MPTQQKDITIRWDEELINIHEGETEDQLRAEGEMPIIADEIVQLSGEIDDSRFQIPKYGFQTRVGEKDMQIQRTKIYPINCRINLCAEGRSGFIPPHQLPPLNIKRIKATFVAPKMPPQIRRRNINLASLHIQEFQPGSTINGNYGESLTDDDSIFELFDACEKGNLEKVRHFISSGGDPNKKDDAGWTALHIAALYNSLDIVKLLVNEYGADVNKLDGRGHSPLHVAIRENHSEVAVFFLKLKQLDRFVRQSAFRLNMQKSKEAKF